MKLFNMALENYKGIRSFTLEPNGKDATVYGANGIGKSTLADAYLWLLTGKDEFDRADYKILPTGEAEGLEASVTAQFQLDDGSSIVLHRVHKPVFTRKRGEAEKHRTGNTTDYYINDVPQKAGDYSKYIAEHFGSEEDIMTVTRSEYFAQVIKPDVRRQKLLTLFAGGVDDASVIAKHKELVPLGEQLGTYAVDDCVKRWKAQRKKVNDDKDAIPGRIDEAERAKPENHPGIDTSQLPHLAAQRLQIISHIDALRSGSAVTDAKAKLSKLQADREQARGEYLRKFSGANTALENQIAAVRKEMSSMEEGLEQYNTTLKAAHTRIESLHKEIPAYRETVKAEMAKQFDPASGVCPTCGHPYPEEKLEELQGNFNEQKARTVTDMQRRGKNMVAELEKQESLHNATSKSINDVTLKIDHDRQKLSELQKMLVAPPAWETTAECADWQTNISAAQESVNAASTNAEEQANKMRAELQPIESEMQEIQQEKTNAVLVKKQDDRIMELKGEEKKLGIQLAELDSLLHLAERFVQLKAADVEAEVNDAFRTVCWKLFELQVNGGIRPCCEATMDGKDYGSLSNAERVNAGLDIVDTLGRKMGLVLPVWIDNAESVSHPLKISAQTISLTVSDEDKKLRVESEDK